MKFKKSLLTLSIIFSSLTVNAQELKTFKGTDIFLFDLNLNAQEKISNGKNITQREGYDNQPSFSSDNKKLVYSSMLDKQADIYQYDLEIEKISQITFTPDTSEYSPIFIPNTNDMSVVMVEKDGVQRLWQYSQNGSSKLVIQDILPVGYYAEGNLGLSNSLLNFLSDKLLKSRMQRDLSDSTVLRNIGSSLGYSLIAYKSCLKGLNKIVPNEEVLNKDLSENIEVITEGIQTVLRVAGIDNPYERMKEISRGNKLNYQELHDYLDTLNLDQNTLTKLKQLTPNRYTGRAITVCDEVLSKARNMYN